MMTILYTLSILYVFLSLIPLLLCVLKFTCFESRLAFLHEFCLAKSLTSKLSLKLLLKSSHLNHYAKKSLIKREKERQKLEQKYHLIRRSPKKK